MRLQFVSMAHTLKMQNGESLFFLYIRYGIHHCFICRPSDSTVLEDAGIEPRTDATSAWTIRRTKTTRLDLIHESQAKTEKIINF